MSLLFMDGFDHYEKLEKKWAVASGLELPTFVTGRFGGKALKKQFQNGAGTNTRSFGQQADVTFGIAYFPPSFPGLTESMWRLLDVAGSVICSIAVTSAGILSITAGGFISSSSTALSTGVWSYIEVHYIPKDASGKGGIAELRVNGSVVAVIDGASFPTTTEADDDVAGFQLLDNGTNSPRYLLDDLYILNASGATNNAYLGDVRITTLLPIADGTSNDWTPLVAGDNFAMVDDEILDSGGADYVESGIIGAEEDYDNQSFADVSVTAGTIFGVQVANATVRTNAGSVTHNNTMTVAGTPFTDAVGVVAGTGATFIDVYIRDTDPSDDAAWTEAKVAAVGSGIKIIAKES